jgi:hypothetical protein
MATSSSKPSKSEGESGSARPWLPCAGVRPDLGLGHEVVATADLERHDLEPVLPEGAVLVTELERLLEGVGLGFLEVRPAQVDTPVGVDRNLESQTAAGHLVGVATSECDSRLEETP